MKSKWMFTKIDDGVRVYLACPYGNYYDSIVPDVALHFGSYDDAHAYRMCHIEQTEEYTIGRYASTTPQ